jgi:RimJ/RimL family protein N-acetyltransferase/GNAT superfamily N-acetyltransferase
MRMTAGSYQLDDDPARIDADAAVAFLTTSVYWATWRTAEDIKQQIASAWRLVGAYDAAGAMVGFARASGDGSSEYLADVYVLPEHRGAGLGKALLRLMVEEGPGAGHRWMLHTSDAHGLYRQFGFVAADSRYLERPRSAPDGPVTPDPLDTDPLETGPLTGDRVRLEPLGHQHAAALAAAGAGGGELYRWTTVPADTEHAHRYIETALAARDRRLAVPYAVVKLADQSVIGSTRFHQLDYWPWPDRAPGLAVPALAVPALAVPALAVPDVAEIGHTWLGPGSIRTGANPEMKRLMLTHAFETWQVKSVCLHTDARNERSRAAMERIGARFDGILPAHRLAADLTPRDSARYSITADRWPAVKEHLAELDARYLKAAVSPG